MNPVPRRVRRVATLVASTALVLGACGSDESATSEAPITTDAPSVTTPAETAPVETARATSTTEDDTAHGDADSSDSATHTVTDRQGDIEVPNEAERIVVTDNRIVRLLDAWGIEIVAAPLDIFPDTISYADDSGVTNLGNHGEPDLEALIASDPDLVLNGYRFSDLYKDITDLVPDAAVVNTDTDYESANPAEELRWLTSLAGEAVGRADDAAALVDDFDASIQRAIDAYDPEQTVMGLLTSGGDISYVAPITGRAVGPLFPILGLTPALDQESDDVTHGDDISVEAIAAANPDWLIVLDRDASFADELDEYSSAEELLAGSEALANVTAIAQGKIVYLPADFYLTEDILVYTELFDRVADAMGSAS